MTRRNKRCPEPPVPRKSASPNPNLRMKNLNLSEMAYGQPYVRLLRLTNADISMYSDWIKCNKRKQNADLSTYSDRIKCNKRKQGQVTVAKTPRTQKRRASRWLSRETNGTKYSCQTPRKELVVCKKLTSTNGNKSQCIRRDAKQKVKYQSIPSKEAKWDWIFDKSSSKPYDSDIHVDITVELPETNGIKREYLCDMCGESCVHESHVCEPFTTPSRNQPDTQRTPDDIAGVVAEQNNATDVKPVNISSTASQANNVQTGGIPYQANVPTGGIPYQANVSTGGIPYQANKSTGGIPCPEGFSIVFGDVSTGGVPCPKGSNFVLDNVQTGGIAYQVNVPTGDIRHTGSRTVLGKDDLILNGQVMQDQTTHRLPDVQPGPVNCSRDIPGSITTGPVNCSRDIPGSITTGPDESTEAQLGEITQVNKETMDYIEHLASSALKGKVPAFTSSNSREYRSLRTALSNVNLIPVTHSASPVVNQIGMPSGHAHEVPNVSPSPISSSFERCSFIVSSTVDSISTAEMSSSKPIEMCPTHDLGASETMIAQNEAGGSPVIPEDNNDASHSKRKLQQPSSTAGSHNHQVIAKRPYLSKPCKLPHPYPNQRVVITCDSGTKCVEFMRSIENLCNQPSPKSKTNTKLSAVTMVNSKPSSGNNSATVSGDNTSTGSSSYASKSASPNNGSTQNRVNSPDMLASVGPNAVNYPTSNNTTQLQRPCTLKQADMSSASPTISAANRPPASSLITGGLPMSHSKAAPLIIPKFIPKTRKSFEKETKPEMYCVFNIPKRKIDVTPGHTHASAQPHGLFTQSPSDPAADVNEPAVQSEPLVTSELQTGFQGGTTGGCSPQGTPPTSASSAVNSSDEVPICIISEVRSSMAGCGSPAVTAQDGSSPSPCAVTLTTVPSTAQHSRTTFSTPATPASQNFEQFQVQPGPFNHAMKVHSTTTAVHSAKSQQSLCDRAVDNTCTQNNLADPQPVALPRSTPERTDESLGQSQAPSEASIPPRSISNGSDPDCQRGASESKAAVSHNVIQNIQEPKQVHRSPNTSTNYDQPVSRKTGATGHNIKRDANNRFLCPGCGKSCLTIQGLDIHFRCAHDASKMPYRCDMCARGFFAYGTKVNHLFSEHRMKFKAELGPALQ